MRAVAVLVVILFVSACSSDPANNGSENNVDTTADAGAIQDAAEDVGTEPDGSTDDAATGSTCEKVTIAAPWELTWADDVSIEYSAVVSPQIEGSEREISLLFERYSPAPDIGSFDLSEAPRDNFGTCPQCMFIRTDVPERAYFQAAGTLESRLDPYGRRIDFTVTGLRLVEVEVNGADRSSTPIPDGRCLEFEEFSAEGVFPPQGWTCLPDKYNDDMTCDCGCGAVDPDCGLQVNCQLGQPDCVPMEPTRLPVVGCMMDQVCAFDPATFGNECIEGCDWAANEGCSNGTCVYDYGAGDGDLCITDPLRVASGVQIGEACPDSSFQIVCNVVNGFAQGHCGANGVCRALCNDDAECTEDGHTCRAFVGDDTFGYCGPEPVDPEG